MQSSSCDALPFRTTSRKRRLLFSCFRRLSQELLHCGFVEFFRHIVPFPVRPVFPHGFHPFENLRISSRELVDQFQRSSRKFLPFRSRRILMQASLCVRIELFPILVNPL